MKVSPRILVLALMVCGAAASAQTTDAPGSGSTASNHGPIAFNAFVGVGYDRLQDSASSGSLTFTGGAVDRAAVRLGGDLGFQFSPSFAVVALGEYAPIFGDANNREVTLGGGLRFGGWGSLGIQGLLGAGWSRFSNDNGSVDGFAVKGFVFAPIVAGFGPFLELSYHHYSSTNFGITGALTDFGAQAGLSFSY